MIQNSLISIVVVSALLFGSVYPWAIAIVAVLTMIPFIYFLWRGNGHAIEFRDGKVIILASLLLFSYPLFQLLPLPLSLLTVIHPKLKEVVTLSPNSPLMFHSISLYPFATEKEASRLFLCLAVFSMAAFGIRDEDGTYKVMRSLVVFGFILGVFALIQHATSNGKIYWFWSPISRNAFLTFGPFVNRDHFAGFIGMIIPFSIGITFMSRRLEKKVLYAFLGVGMAIALFFTLSRGGIISFFAGLLVFSTVLFTKGISKRKLIPIVLFVLVLIAYLLFFGASPIIEKFAQSKESAGARVLAWQTTLSAFRDYPVFGSGFGTFQYIFKVYQPEGLRLYWAHAHNDYLELLLELGIIGTVIAIFFFLVVLRTIMTADWRGRELYLGAALLSSITTIAVHSIVDFNLHIPSNALLFSLVLGLIVSLCRTTMDTSKTRLPWHH
ncbi:MAG TPA: O-antigen ligase family protein, partial [Thermodesulfovibrionales bacterium]|nr:O-antigen ligase family protein [Thermodesulfovibrionales bacterium]